MRAAARVRIAPEELLGLGRTDCRQVREPDFANNRHSPECELCVP